MRKKNDYKSLEKEARRALKEQTSAKREEDDEEEVYVSDNIADMTAIQRLKAIKNGNITTSEEDKPTSITEQTDVQMVSPLPMNLTSDFIPIEKIVNGVMYTEDNRYVTLVEVLPVNFLLKSVADQGSIVDDFALWLKQAPDHFQILSVSKRTDITKYIDKINEYMEKETNENCRLLQEDYKQLIQRIGIRNTVSHRYFVVLEYKPNGIKPKQGEIEAELDVMRSRLANSLKSCGNRCILVENTTEEICEIMFELLNRTAAKSDFFWRIQNVRDYYTDTYGEDSLDDIHITEYFSPEKINFKNSNFTKINDTYYDFMFVSTKGYPVNVVNGWSALMINAHEGIDVKIDIRKEDRGKTLTRVGRRIRINSYRARNLGTSTEEYETMANSVRAGYYIKDALANNNEDLYYMTMLVAITASSLEELNWKRREFKSYLSTREFMTRNCNFMQDEALLSYLPIGYMSPTIFNRGKRNVTTSDLASIYPFTAFEMSDENGIFLGLNENNSSLVITDFFNSKKYKNANISILGTSGAGKTYLTQLITTRMRRNGIQVFIIAPDKGYEFERACQKIGGEFITIAPSSSQCINAMEIRPRDDRATALLEGKKKLTNQSRLAEKIESLHIFFELLIPDMSAEEVQLLDEALVKTYEKKGITHNNNSLIDERYSDGRYKEMPLLGDLLETLLQNERAIRIANITKRLVTGSAKSFNQQTNVNLDNPYVVIDISPLDGSALLPVGMYLALDYVYSKAKEDRTKKKAIVVDETWKLISSNQKAAEYVLEIFKIIRGYGGSAICATQDLNDFFALEDGRYGKGIINNSKTKIILNLEKAEAESVGKLLDLSPSELNSIMKFERGHGLLSTNGNNVAIEFKSSDMERRLITTDRADLEALVQEAEDEDELYLDEIEAEEENVKG